ncbi:hypothetical protein GWI33_005102 [Rhynchophorus ferrugineus]|uniref:Uncharacterized protein n=1 Tax=Rhynchophorus ferrugineus TaxID=354439 RepID=A0A834IWE7_RHYFE|nr:hypothetical protein GWI33_005102 [Rhynchophorus ferrugineus]
MDMEKQTEQVDTILPPPPEKIDEKMDQSTLPRASKELSSSSAKMMDNHTMTLSTKMSTDRLICKSPRESPAGSFIDKKGKQIITPNRVLMVLSILQFILGFLMVLFGMYVIAYKASLSQIGGGIWGGIIAMVTGIAGTLAAAKNVCPFKTTAEKVAQTTFLAMSLISLAVSQLIVVIAATGLARDVNSTSFQEAMQQNDDMSNFGKFSMEISENYKGILYNIILVIIASLECIVAAIASYKSSREVCPCFKRNDEYYQDNLNMHRSHALVSSWLMGKHGGSVPSPTPIYVVTGPNSSLGRGSKIVSTEISPDQRRKKLTVVLISETFSETSQEEVYLIAV